MHPRSLARCLTIALLTTMALSAAGLVLPTAAQAQSFSVSTNADTGAGSLRQAIIDANNYSYANGGAATTITIQTGLGTITLASNLPLIGGSTTITGNGATLDGASTYRGFLISAWTGEVWSMKHETTGRSAPITIALLVMAGLLWIAVLAVLVLAVPHYERVYRSENRSLPDPRSGRWQRAAGPTTGISCRCSG